MFFDEAYSQAINGYDSVLDELSKSDLVIVIGTMLQTGLANGIVSRSVSAQTQIIEINMNQEILKGKTMTLLGKAEEVVPQIANIIGPRSQCEKCSKSKSPGRRKKSPEKPTKGMKAPEPPSKGKASKK
jgi:NAD-dependent SIR2 family protein deacetylase